MSRTQSIVTMVLALAAIGCGLVSFRIEWLLAFEINTIVGAVAGAWMLYIFALPIRGAWRGGRRTLAAIRILYLLLLIGSITLSAFYTFVAASMLSWSS